MPFNDSASTSDRPSAASGSAPAGMINEVIDLFKSGRTLESRGQTADLNALQAAQQNRDALSSTDSYTRMDAISGRSKEAGLSFERLRHLAEKYPDNQYMRSIVDNFDKLDKDHNGVLSNDELREAVSKQATCKLNEIAGGENSPKEDIEFARQFSEAVDKLRIRHDARSEVLADLFADIRESNEFFCEMYPDEVDNKFRGDHMVRNFALREAEPLNTKLYDPGLSAWDLTKYAELQYFVQGDNTYRLFAQWLTQPDRFKKYDNNGNEKIDVAEQNAAWQTYLMEHQRGS